MNNSIITNCYFQGYFESANGLELYDQSWYPQNSARAVLVIVPGHGGAGEPGGEN